MFLLPGKCRARATCWFVGSRTNEKTPLDSTFLWLSNISYIWNRTYLPLHACYFYILFSSFLTLQNYPSFYMQCYTITVLMPEPENTLLEVLQKGGKNSQKERLDEMQINLNKIRPALSTRSNSAPWRWSATFSHRDIAEAHRLSYDTLTHPPYSADI